MAENKESILKRITQYRSFGLLVGMVILIILGLIITPAMFKVDSIISMLRNNSIYAILAIGMMFVLLTGGIDLSVGSTLALTGVITSLLMSNNPGVPAIVWVLVSLIIGALCGFINGFLIGKLNMIPMISTLGTMYAFRGLAFLVSGGNWLFPHLFTSGYTWYAEGSFLGIYNITWIAIILFALAAIFLAITKPGRRIYAIGTSSESSKISGINEGNVKILAYTLCGTLSGLAGMLYTANHAISFYGMAEGFEMQAIAICILGGVSIVGGKGRIDGVVISTVMMGFISYFISLLPGLSVWQDAIQGGIIIIAVAINIITLKMADKRALKERGALI